MSIQRNDHTGVDYEPRGLECWIIGAPDIMPDESVDSAEYVDESEAFHAAVENATEDAPMVGVWHYTELHPEPCLVAVAINHKLYTEE